MDTDPKDNPPLRDRISHLGKHLEVLSRAIRDELDWRDKLEPTEDPQVEGADAP